MVGVAVAGFGYLVARCHEVGNQRLARLRLLRRFREPDERLEVAAERVRRLPGMSTVGCVRVGLGVFQKAQHHLAPRAP